MKQQEREAILWEGLERVERPALRRELEGLREDLESIPLRGQPIPLRLRNFRANADGYLAALGGPLAYMVRLRQIDELTKAHQTELEDRWRALADETTDSEAFAAAWTAAVAATHFDDVNDLIDAHNRWYPAESRLPMDPRRGDYALVNGKDYRRAPLGAAWALEQFPPDLAVARTG